MASTFLEEILPIPVVAAAGSVVSFLSILTLEFGATFGGYQDFWITYEGSAFFQSYSFSYWNPTHPSTSNWLVNGQDIGPDVANQRYVPLSQIGTAALDR